MSEFYISYINIHLEKEMWIFKKFFPEIYRSNSTTLLKAVCLNGIQFKTDVTAGAGISNNKKDN